MHVALPDNMMFITFVDVLLVTLLFNRLFVAFHGKVLLVTFSLYLCACGIVFQRFVCANISRVAGDITSSCSRYSLTECL